MPLAEKIVEAHENAIKEAISYCKQNDLKLGTKCPLIKITKNEPVDAFISGMVEGSHAFLLTPGIALSYFKGIYKNLLPKK